MSYRRRLSCLAFLAVLPLALPAADAPKSPLSPQEVLKHFRLTPGLRMELVAAEPTISSPVAMTFDEHGKMWVVEMLDYPNGPKPGAKPEGRIKILEDKDGDGVFETSTVFADNLLFANGLLLWKGGVVVTMAPHVVSLKDTDGDGKADAREVLYEGFAAENPQLRVSHPVLGLDGWVYVANGLRGGSARPANRPGAPPVSLAGMDFRFNLLDGRYEAISGLGQFGNTFDDWGNRFVCDNRHHLRHVVMESRYLKRNPFLAAPELVQDISVLEDGPLSSGGKIYPLSKNWTTSSLHVGRFTAACGVMIYRGDLLPKEYHGGAFTCDPTGNLVHQEVMEPHGATFRSRPAKAGVEFLATPDEWFRPVSLSHGPDGALYVVDMYRAVIEHPEFMPAELKNRPDLTLGKERGRIWRIVPNSLSGRPQGGALSKATPQQLVKHLASPNPWVRTTAQRLLLERQDRAAVEPLKAATAAANALQRMHAAWLLESFGALDEKTVLRLLDDPEPGVRRQAVLLAEPRLPGSPAVQKRFVLLSTDSDAHVRFQASCSAGGWEDNAFVMHQMHRTGILEAHDRWARLALVAAASKRAGLLITDWLETNPPQEATPERLTLLRELAAVVGARRDAEEVAGLLGTLASLNSPKDRPWALAGLEGLTEGMGRRGTQLSAFLGTLPEARRPAVAQAEKLLARAATLAADAKAAPVERQSAARLLAHAPWPTAEPVLARLLNDDASQDLRLAAVRALAAHARPEVPPLLMKGWRAYTPALRREVTEAMLRQPDRAPVLLDEIEAKRVQPGDLDANRTRQLVNSGRPDVRDRARKLLQDNLPAERKDVMARYQAALKLKGDAKRGQAVFQKNCATCHKVNGIGVDVGPDIADTRTKTPDQLLLDILNPNAAIDNNYVNYEVTLKSGRVLTGVIAAETPTAVTLRRAENQTDAVLRQDIDEIRSTGVSLMPDGLEKTVTVEEVADLIRFLKDWRYLDGSVPVGP